MDMSGRLMDFFPTGGRTSLQAGNAGILQIMYNKQQGHLPG